MNYSLEQLIMFEAVSRLGSFTLAAQEVYRAKSAVSHGVKALEDALGLTLLRRSTRSVTVTPEGQLILPKVREILKDTHILEQLAMDLKGEQEASMTLVVDGAAPVREIMRAVRELTQQPIATKIKVVVEHLHKVRERFDSEQASMMVTFGFKSEADLKTIDLAPIESLLVVHKDHPLAQSQSTLDRSDLSQYIELIVAGCIGDPIDIHHDLSLGGDHLIEVSDFSLKKQAIISGVGFGWLPRHLISDELVHKTVKLVPLREGSSRWLSPQLVYRLDPPLGTTGRRLLETLQAGIL